MKEIIFQDLTCVYHIFLPGNNMLKFLNQWIMFITDNLEKIRYCGCDKKKAKYYDKDETKQI